MLFFVLNFRDHVFALFSLAKFFFDHVFALFSLAKFFFSVFLFRFFSGFLKKMSSTSGSVDFRPVSGGGYSSDAESSDRSDRTSESDPLSERQLSPIGGEICPVMVSVSVKVPGFLKVNAGDVVMLLVARNQAQGEVIVKYMHSEEQGRVPRHALLLSHHNWNVFLNVLPFLVNHPSLLERVVREEFVKRSVLVELLEAKALLKPALEALLSLEESSVAFREGKEKTQKSSFFFFKKKKKRFSGHVVGWDSVVAFSIERIQKDVCDSCSVACIKVFILGSRRSSSCASFCSFSVGRHCIIGTSRFGVIFAEPELGEERRVVEELDLLFTFCVPCTFPAWRNCRSCVGRHFVSHAATFQGASAGCEQN